MTRSSSPSSSGSRPQETLLPRSPDRANSLLAQLLAPLASLRLTVVLIVLAMFLIYAGTWAQIDQGIWFVQKKYFHSAFVWIDPALFLKRAADGSLRTFRIFGINLLIPMLGGYALGLLLLINLVTAHALRFKGTWKDLVLIPAIALSIAIASFFDASHFWSLVGLITLSPLPILAAVAPLHTKRTGVIMIHLGLIMLLVGEGVTSGLAVESRMPIREGGTATYSMDTREAELAIVDTSPSDHNNVAAIGASMLKTGAVIAHAGLPVEVKVDQYYPNAELLGPMQAGDRKDARATAGSAKGVTLLERPPVTGVDTEGDIDFPAAYVTLTTTGKEGAQSLGTFLLSSLIDPVTWEPVIPSQSFQVDGKTYEIELRFKRLLKPYRMQLLDFTHDKYIGTNTPKDFASQVRLIDTTRGVDREVRIWMNNPLRYHGETFYQASFMPRDDGTVLQVVSNPGWLMPYVACAIGAVGLVIHFGLKLLGFIWKTVKTPLNAMPAAKGAKASGEARTPWLSLPSLAAVSIVAIGFVVMLAYVLRPVGPKPAFDLKTFATLPISHDGRIQPLDSLARNSLKLIAGRERAVLKDGTRISPAHWLADVFGKPEQAVEYPIFRIDNPQLLGMLKFDAGEKYFSLRQLLDQREELQKQIESAQNVSDKDRDAFQRHVLELGQKMALYFKLGQMESLFLVPPLKETQSWQSLGEALRGGNTSNTGGEAYLNLVKSLHEDKPETFNKDVAAFAAKFDSALPKESRRVHFEALFNRLDPFTICIGLYLVAFVLSFVSWLFWGVPLRRAAMVAILLALAIHTAGLIARIYISGRPPVTNLAASAIFIAWGAVVLAVALEIFYRNGIGSIAAAVMGFSSLLIADFLALSGDTLKVLQAVLDTNFWLATHVIMITLGYSATFLAGIIGVVYVIAALIKFISGNVERSPLLKDLVRMIYGITCFAILFSFVGTILGGIWADQSWGRFWGWDPKENGAVLIVLANALLLHARWAGLARDRGIVALALLGNIITSWSWFGTNMLGVGLHSYGFMESALYVLLAFVVSQILLIGLAYLPALARQNIQPGG